MFDLVHTTSTSDNAGMAGLRADKLLADVGRGLVSGTKVATQMGWRPVEAVAAGDQVLTFDGGLQYVTDVRRDVIWTGGSQGAPDTWPLFVPAGALGNREDMYLMPHQAVLVESDTAEAVFGDPFAMIPAAALEGFRGICRVAPAERIEIVTITFAQDEVVFANIGALFFCPASTDLLDMPASDYATMSLEQADTLVGFLEMEDMGHVPVKQATAAFRMVA
ncbi:Hint domain-containing protein [Yoonia sp. 208BN28-4]|uniref:Hint domain-containing protein n=1 Tax=Yoonia sp. 208BN28-4 TaxID=3126505 RepID=UPI0030A17708